MWQTAKPSHHPGAFRPVPQSCTAGTLLRRKTEIPSGHATLTLTYIIKQALNPSEFPIIHFFLIHG